MAASDGGRSLESNIDSISFGLDSEDQVALQEQDIQTTVPAQVFRLQYISAACLVINTMVGKYFNLGGARNENTDNEKALEFSIRLPQL